MFDKLLSGMVKVLFAMSSVLMNQQYMLIGCLLNRSTHKARLGVDPVDENVMSGSSQEPHPVCPFGDIAQ